MFQFPGIGIYKIFRIIFVEDASRYRKPNARSKRDYEASNRSRSRLFTSFKIIIPLVTTRIHLEARRPGLARVLISNYYFCPRPSPSIDCHSTRYKISSKHVSLFLFSTDLISREIDETIFRRLKVKKGNQFRVFDTQRRYREINELLRDIGSSFVTN